MTMSRREFCVIPAGVLATTASTRARPPAGAPSTPPATAAPTGSHLGNLYPFVQGQADRSTLELSFLQPEFKRLGEWQPKARARVFEHLFYAPPPVSPQPQLVRRTDRGEYV